MNQNMILDWNYYLQTARETVTEGCVLLENKNHVLPLQSGMKVSIFGRIQTHYYKSGTGSGGMVNVSKVTSIPEGLQESGIIFINEELLNIYQTWEEKHPFDKGMGWGCEPWSQEEMPLTDEIVAQANTVSDIALVIIGRTAGEDKDGSDTKGSYRLTDIEEDMLAKVRRHFQKMVVVLNVGNIIDMEWMDTYQPDAVLYAWQGGMTGGSGIADILTGVVSPSGKLTDTIAYHISDYPSDANFGDDDRNFYCEDIYVGYRYFETFAKEKVRYPFGFGLSYTTFEIRTTAAYYNAEEQTIEITVSVCNTGTAPGKEVVQIYGEAPQGKLGKAVRNLLAFAKTRLLAPEESQELTFAIPLSRLSSYDDSGITGHKSCYLLEEGTYHIYVGTDVRCASNILSFTLDALVITEALTEALAPVQGFKRFKPSAVSEGSYKITEETVPLLTISEDDRRKQNLPEDIPYTGDQNIQLKDVLNDTATMEQFIAQFTDDDLSCIIRGEGMGSSRVTPGTASAFGGVSEHLIQMGIPAVCCDDGPSGMRLDCGTKAFSLPNGTMIGCTFNPELTEELFRLLGMEMLSNRVECLLGPGMNIHRHPLNGRNFEYFSEDPYLTGIMAIAQLKGLHNSGVTGTIKHFCANNQEYRRRFTDSIVSERALREIYLKGFEMAVRSGNADSIMTTYGSVNGLFTSGNYDLNTTILRNEWNFKGIVMTDWWAGINERNQPQSYTNFAAMARSQNDLYMVCPDGSKNATGDNTMEALENGTLTRGELQRNAANICEFVMHTEAMKRLLGTADKVEILNRPVEKDDCDIENVEYLQLSDSITIPLEDKTSTAETNYIFALDVQNCGDYRIILSGSSKLSELAQITCTLFYSGTPVSTFTFNGTNGATVSQERTFTFHHRFTILRLYVAGNGLDLKEIKFEKKSRD